MREIINSMSEKIQNMVMGIVTVEYIQSIDMIRIEIYTPNYTWSHDIHRLNAELDADICESIVELYKNNILSHFVRM